MPGRLISMGAAFAAGAAAGEAAGAEDWVATPPPSSPEASPAEAGAFIAGGSAVFGAFNTPSSPGWTPLVTRRVPALPSTALVVESRASVRRLNIFGS